MVNKQIVTFIQTYNKQGYSIQAIQEHLILYYSEQDIKDAIAYYTRPRAFDKKSILLILLFILLFIGGTVLVGILNGNLYSKTPSYVSLNKVVSPNEFEDSSNCYILVDDELKNICSDKETISDT